MRGGMPCGLAVTVLLASTLAGCIGLGGPPSMRDVMRMQWEPGPLEIEGLVTDVQEVDGRTWLGLDNAWKGDGEEDLCGGVLVDGDEYAVGDRFRGTIHFEEGTWDGIPMLWSPEMPCPFPVMVDSIGSLMEEVSWVIGASWIPKDDDSRTSFEVITRWGRSFDPAAMEIQVLERVWLGLPDTDEWVSSDRKRTWGGDRIDSLDDWTEAVGWLFVQASDWSRTSGGSDLTHLAEEPTLRGVLPATGLDIPQTVSWDDGDDDGMLGTGDVLNMGLPARPGRWNTLVMLDTGCVMPDCPGGVHLMLLAPDGTVRSRGPDSLVQFLADPEEAVAPLEIPVGRTFGRPVPIQAVSVLWNQEREGSLASGSESWSFDDADHDGMLSTGDALRIEQAGDMRLVSERNEQIEHFEVG